MNMMSLTDDKFKTGLSVKQYLFRLVVAGGFLLLCSFCNVFASVVAAYRTPNIRIVTTAGEMTSTRILPDLGHYFLDYIQGYMDNTTAYYFENIDPNYFIQHIMHSFVVMLIIHPQRLMMARRTCGIVGYVFLARAICVLSTSMPDAHRQCYEQFGTPAGAYKDTPIFPQAVFTTFTTMSQFSDSVTCGDMIFSGHMVLITLGGLFFGKYCNKRDMASPLIRYLPSCFCLICRCFIYLCCVLGTIAIIKSHLHYTVDVVISLYFSLNSWNVYHRTARDIFNKTDTQGFRLFEYSPFSSFFGWLEATEMQVQDAFVWESIKRNRQSNGSFDSEDDIPLMNSEYTGQV